ncbi:DEAD/DEAH box helicase [Schaalia suimastitidis]|uniref:DEAD/DEAH box helicase n=1 Tax=Schaalia suimastitidis TaxID=121163 RepID=UPI0004790D60|nr:DEAD/DEAH box helicase [Schaalia suimastitidis]
MSPARRRRRATASSAEPPRTQDMELLSPSQRFAAFKSAQAEEASLRHQWTARLPYQPDTFQVEAMDALESGNTVLVAAPTGAGKTVVGEFATYLALQAGKRAFYTTPIKALSNQKYFDLQKIFGEHTVGLLTGDVSVNPGAPIVVMTTEVLRNMIYANADLSDLSHVILDEVHYLADRMRGPVWEEVIIHAPDHVNIVALSATVSNAEEFGAWLNEVRGSCSVILSEDRPVPLFQHMMVGDRLLDVYAPSRKGHGPSARINPQLLSATSPVGRPRGTKAGGVRETRLGVLAALRGRDLLPAIVFIFSRQGCEDAVRQVMAGGLVLTDRREAAQIRIAIDEVMASIDVRDHAALGLGAWARALEAGVAAHHAGLLPLIKETVERLFTRGLVKVVFATETLALGINMPARTVVIESLFKWNGAQHVMLSAGEYTQLSGRAGRRGIDTEGHAVVLHRGQVAPEELAALASKRTYPLISAFRPTYNMVANLLTHATRAATREVLETSFAQFQADGAVVTLARQARRAQQQVDLLAQELHCDAGDAQEYFALREEIARLQKEQAKARTQIDRDRAVKDLHRCRRGDIVRYRKGRRVLHAVVCETATGAGHNAVGVRALGTDGKWHHIGAHNAMQWIGVVGRMTVPTPQNLRRASVRAAIGNELSHLVRTGSLEVQGSGDTILPSSATEELEQRLRAHPVHRCPERESHARAGHGWARAKREADRLLAAIDGRTNSVAKEFDKVCDVLDRLAFLSGDQVTDAGRALTHVFGERDLVIVEALRGGALRGLDAAQLAGAVSCFVYESRGEAGESAQVPSRIEGPLRQAWREACGAHERIAKVEAEVGVAHMTPCVDGGIMAATAAWARGASLTTALSECDLAGGDFVRWMRQVMDLLDQLRHVGDEALAQRAREARDALAHGVVSWSAL